MSSTMNEDKGIRKGLQVVPIAELVTITREVYRQADTKTYSAVGLTGLIAYLASR